MDTARWGQAWQDFRAWFDRRFHDGELLDLWMGANVETWQGLDAYPRDDLSDDDRAGNRNRGANIEV